MCSFAVSIVPSHCLAIVSITCRNSDVLYVRMYLYIYIFIFIYMWLVYQNIHRQIWLCKSKSCISIYMYTCTHIWICQLKPCISICIKISICQWNPVYQNIQTHRSKSVSQNPIYINIYKYRYESVSQYHVYQCIHTHRFESVCQDHVY